MLNKVFLLTLPFSNFLEVSFKRDLISHYGGSKCKSFILKPPLSFGSLHENLTLSLNGLCHFVGSKYLRRFSCKESIAISCSKFDTSLTLRKCFAKFEKKHGGEMTSYLPRQLVCRWALFGSSAVKWCTVASPRILWGKGFPRSGKRPHCKDITSNQVPDTNDMLLYRAVLLCK